MSLINGNYLNQNYDPQILKKTKETVEDEPLDVSDIKTEEEIIQQTVTEDESDIVPVTDIPVDTLIACSNLNIEKPEAEKPTLAEVIKQMGLRSTYCKGVYCQKHNPDMPEGDYTHQRHFVWNSATHEMVELKGIYYIDSSGRQAWKCDGYDLVLAHRYGFTPQEDGTFVRADVVYTCDSKMNRFVKYQAPEPENTNDTTADSVDTPAPAEETPVENTVETTEDNNVTQTDDVSETEEPKNTPVVEDEEKVTPNYDKEFEEFFAEHYGTRYFKILFPDADVAKEFMKLYYNKLRAAGITDQNISKITDRFVAQYYSNDNTKNLCICVEQMENAIRQSCGGYRISDEEFTKEEVQIIGALFDAKGDGLSDEEFENLVKAGFLIKDGDIYKMSKDRYYEGIGHMLADITNDIWNRYPNANTDVKNKDELISNGWLVGPVNGKYVPNGNIETIKNYLNNPYLGNFPTQETVSKLYEYREFLDSVISYLYQTSNMYTPDLKNKIIDENLTYCLYNALISSDKMDICDALFNLCKKYNFSLTHSNSGWDYTFTLTAPNGVKTEFTIKNDYDSTIARFLGWSGI